MSLAHAIDALYATFAAVSKPAIIDGCECCWDAAQAEAILASPLRALTADCLSEYAASVFLTVGDVADFRYLLPRILEIGATTGFSWPDTEVLLGKLKLAGWVDWSEHEQAAIQALLDAWFEKVLSEKPCECADRIWWHEGDSLLCGLAGAGLDLDPYLSRLLDPAYALQLRALYGMNVDKSSGEVRLRNPFWRDTSKPTIADYPSGAALEGFLNRQDVKARASL